MSLSKTRYKCSKCERVYDYHNHAVYVDTQSQTLVMKCPTDGAVAYWYDGDISSYDVEGAFDLMDVKVDNESKSVIFTMNRDETKQNKLSVKTDTPELIHIELTDDTLLVNHLAYPKQENNIKTFFKINPTLNLLENHEPYTTVTTYGSLLFMVNSDNNTMYKNGDVTISYIHIKQHIINNSDSLILSFDKETEEMIKQYVNTMKEQVLAYENGDESVYSASIDVDIKTFNVGETGLMYTKNVNTLLVEFSLHMDNSDNPKTYIRVTELSNTINYLDKLLSDEGVRNVELTVNNLQLFDFES